MAFDLSSTGTLRKIFRDLVAAGGVVNGAVGFLQDTHDAFLALLPATMRLPSPQGNVRPSPAPPVPGTEPVAANGEFTVKETDVTLPGFGLPFTFTRYYRSGVDYQSALGWGWNHNFGLRLVEAVGTYDSPQGCAAAHNDVFVVTEWMDRLRFAFASSDGAIDHYASRFGKHGYRLRRDHRASEAPWVLEDGNGREYRFHAGWGTLASINDLAGHALILNWDRTGTGWDSLGGKLMDVMDTTGRRVYFNYQLAKFIVNTPQAREYQFEALRCLSLTPGCASPLVSFQTRGAIGPYLSGQIRVEFDLVRALDGNGNGPTYIYYDGDNPVLGIRDATEIPFGDLPGACASICSAKPVNCRSADACSAFVAAQVDRCAAITRPGILPLPHPCFLWCLSQEDYKDNEGFARARERCSQLTTPVVSNDPLPHLALPGCEPFRSLCLQRIGDTEAAVTVCRNLCQVECLLAKATAPAYIYGLKPALTHNLIRVIDGDGRGLVENIYGEDPESPDFDKVTIHRQGQELNNTLSFTYYDLHGPTPPKRAVDQYVVPLRQFNSLDICPSGGPAPAAYRLGPRSIQPPKYATVIVDADKVVRTNYHDLAWRLIRSINYGPLFANYLLYVPRPEFDLNYRDGALSAIQFPAGNRVCVDTDPLGKPTLLTEYPAHGYPGEQTPLVTEFTYDDREQLIEVVRNPGSSRPSGRHFIRDVYERVIAIGDQVDTFHTTWTCYWYRDPINLFFWLGTVPWTDESIVERWPRRGEAESVSIRKRLQRSYRSEAELAAANLGARASMFFPSGCAVPLLTATAPAVRPPQDDDPSRAILSLFPRRRDDLPSTITRPDGSVTALAALASGGPGEVTIDVNGQDPLRSYSLFDELGRMRETGRLLTQNGAVVRSPVLRRLYDAAGLLARQSTADPNNGAWVDTTYGYDRSHHLTSVRTAEFSRQMTHTALGDLQTITDVPSHGSAKERTTCLEFDVQGRLRSRVLPEGNLERYHYDTAGRLMNASKGYANAPLGGWAARCSPRIVSPQVGTAAMEEITAFAYDAAGFLANALVDGTRVYFTVDGFGRVIATRLPDHDGGNGTVQRHLVKGYNTDGRIGWEGVFDTPPEGFAKPTGLQGGLHAFSEYQYDLIGRRTARKRWRFTEGPLAADPQGLIAATTIGYDDSTNTVTTTDEGGRVSIRQTDGAGRLLTDVRAAGSVDELSLTFSYSLGGTSMDVTLKPVPVPGGRLVESFRFDPMGRLRSVTNGSRRLYTERQDLLGRPKERTLAGLGKQSLEYDGFGRLAAVHQWVASDGSPITSTYGWNGNDLLERATDGAGHSTVNTFDGLDRIASVTNGIGRASFDYARGTQRIVLRLDPSGATHQMTYDPAGRVARIVSSADDSSITREFAYTALDQLRLATLLGTHGNAVTFDYDSLGRKRSEANSALGLAVGHSYSAVSRTTALRQGDTILAAVTETHDMLFRPRALVMNGALLATLSYANGALSTILYQNGARETFEYDNRGRVTSAKVDGADAAAAAITDVLGADGVLRQRQRRFGSLRPITDLYQVDLAGRLQAENNRVPSARLLTGEIGNRDVQSLAGPAYPWTGYSLDGASNWTARTGPGALRTVIDAANRFGQINGASVGYDGNGHTRSFGGVAYRFDVLGQLAAVSAPGIQRNYEYDALGRRIWESDSQSTESILWDGPTILGLQPEGRVEATRLHVGSDGHSVLALADTLGRGRVFFLHPGTDRSTLAATDARGKLVEGYAYSAYGETTFVDPVSGAAAKSKIGNRRLFQGHMFEPGLGLYMLPAREYQPRWGRFLSPDPIGIAGGLNLYAYVGARPLSHIDVTGLSGTRLPQQAPSPHGYAGNMLADFWMSRGAPFAFQPREPGWREIREDVEAQIEDVARSNRELRQFSRSSALGYEYRKDTIIGSEVPGRVLADHQGVMTMLKLYPSAYFPFDVVARHDEQGIVRGGEYELVNRPGSRLPLLSGRWPVRVTAETPTSFTFTALEGHFDPPGSTIKFSTWVDVNRNVHLEQHGLALPSQQPDVQFIVAPYIAEFLAWREQAENLRKWLEQVGR